MTAADRFRFAERIIRPVSWLTLLTLIVFALLRHTTDLPLDQWSSGKWMQVLTAAAVGYLTNYIAIEMLFKPYTREEAHWLRLLGWRQGLIPANKTRIGQVLGEEIPQNLLNPDEIAEELGRAGADLLGDETVLMQFREKANRFMQRYADPFSSMIAPWVESAVREAIRENLTPENLRKFWDGAIADYLSSHTNRREIAQAITGEFQKYAPDITRFLHRNLKAGVRDYLQQKLRLLPSVLVPGDLAAGLVDYLDWQQIEQQVEEKLADPELQHTIHRELLNFSLRLRDYLATPQGEAQLQAFVTAGSSQIESYLHDYLAAKLPELTDRLLNSDELWEIIRTQLLPMAQSALLHYLRRAGKEAIVRKLDLPNRIQRSVEKQDVRDFHRMLNKVAEEHLVAIQVLGYILGAAAGGLLCLAD